MTENNDKNLQNNNNQNQQPNNQASDNNTDKATQMANEGKHLQEMMALIDEKEKSSEIADLNNKPAFLTINKGQRNEYILEVMFPGVAKASELRDDARNGYGTIDQTYFMKEIAIKELIVRPKIYSLDWFGRRGGYDDAFNQIYGWFLDCINGRPYREED